MPTKRYRIYIDESGDHTFHKLEAPDKMGKPQQVGLLTLALHGLSVFKILNQYRNIGPFRAGRTVGAVGMPTQPKVFYLGVNNGGVWKTDGYGRTWKPIFDET